MEKVRLGDIVSKQITGEWGAELKNEEKGTAVIRTANFRNDGIIDYEKIVYRSINKDKVKEKYLLKGDIIIEKSGGTDNNPVGRVVLFEGDNNKFISNNFTQVLRVNDSNYYKYIFYQLFYKYNNGSTLSMFNKTTGIQNLQMKSYLDQAIIVEPLKRQIEIANKLDKVQEIIDIRKEQIRQLEELAKSQFVEMFGDLKANPFDWPLLKISDISTYLKSGLSRKLFDDDIGIPVIRSGNIQKGRFIYDDIKYWYKDDPQGANTNDYVLDDGDILINFINSSSQIGKTAIFNDAGRKCIYTTNIFRMKLNSNCNKYYYNWYAMTDYYYRQLQNIIQPAVNQASFTTSNFLKLSIPLPPIKLQNQFADIVKQIDKQKLEYEKSLAEMQNLMDSLMNKYFIS